MNENNTAIPNYKADQTRRLMLALNHSRPSYRPSPDVAQAACSEELSLVGNEAATCPTYLDIPGSLPEAVQPQLVSNFGGVHGIGQILLVGVNEQKGIAKLVLVKHPLEFFARFRNTFSVVGINDKDDSLGVLVVCRALRKIAKSKGGEATHNASREGGSCPGHRHPRR